MFKKHVYTCPDIIYLIEKQKKINRAVLGAYAIFFGGLGVAAYVADRKKLVPPNIDIPDET